MESWTKYIRLYDVFISGPLYIVLSLYTLRHNTLLGLFVLLTGIMTIVFNLHNWLLIDKQKINKILPWTDPKQGKYQFHRLFNLLIMYPLLFYSNMITKEKPCWLTVVLYLMIIIGFIFNLYWFVRIFQESKT